MGRVTDFEIDPAWASKDPADAHVHSAAVACQADMLVTCNTKGFPEADAPYEVYHPDDFFVLLDDSASQLVRDAALNQVQYWFKRGEEFHLPQQLRSADCPQFAERVRRHLNGPGFLPLL